MNVYIRNLANSHVYRQDHDLSCELLMVLSVTPWPCRETETSGDLGIGSSSSYPSRSTTTKICSSKKSSSLFRVAVGQRIPQS
ncbi:hypothetical protein ElyMa_006473900 [Elysia marginata]|uniref:Uncharacterized protein n=1 Tax=Elysia marginata TaxID=1093978 RepID=A0AAV4I0Q8_9GAST|nr:hypothetical protein ElyMa_006473900 [Elysia marginata]